tara:strand:+ start:1661 stop:3064 length:1404 start_codon:yes stop_codon:yes gene_type:complete
MFFPLIKELLSDARGDAALSVNEVISKNFPQYRSSIANGDENYFNEIVTTDYINIKSQFPLWIRDLGNSHLISLIQLYYDWLYNKDSSGYILDNIFANIKDIDNCPDDLVMHLLPAYAPDFVKLSTVLRVNNELSPNAIYDFNNDGIIDGTDMTDLLTNFGTKEQQFPPGHPDEGEPGCGPGEDCVEVITDTGDLLYDVTGDGFVDGADLTQFVGFFGQEVTSTLNVSDALLLDINNIRNFIRSIQDRFYAIKGSKQSIAYFFTTLFGADSVSVENDGEGGYALEIFFPEPYSLINWNQIVDVYMQTVHPVGYRLNSIIQSVTTQDSGVVQLRSGESGGFDGDIPQFTAWEELTYGDGAYDGTGTGEEISILGNYFPYTIGDTEDIAATAGCSGATVSGITAGATGNTYTNMTTYAFPDWSTAVTIAGTSFGLINIYDFAYLSAASGNTSPNDGRATNNACPVGGYS